MACRYPKMIKAPKRLTLTQIKQLKQLRKQGMKLRVLSERFGICTSTVCRIANGTRRSAA
jgi:hypothetical protein